MLLSYRFNLITSEKVLQHLILSNTSIYKEIIIYTQK